MTDTGSDSSLHLAQVEQTRLENEKLKFELARLAKSGGVLSNT
jgi:hypothetical protein